MPSSRKPRWARALGLVALVATTGAGASSAAPSSDLTADPAALLLQSLHPDFATFVGAVRPIVPSGDGAGPAVYMALVRPGADDPTAPQSAPFAGPGARNDIL